MCEWFAEYILAGGKCCFCCLFFRSVSVLNSCSGTSRLNMNYSPRLISISSLNDLRQEMWNDKILLIIKEGAAIGNGQMNTSTHERTNESLPGWKRDEIIQLAENGSVSFPSPFSFSPLFYFFFLSRNDKFNARVNSGTLTGFVFTSLIVCEFTFFRYFSTLLFSRRSSGLYACELWVQWLHREFSASRSMPFDNGCFGIV